MEVSNGKYYAGTNNINPTHELILNDLVKDGRNDFGGSRDAILYHFLKSNIKKFLDNTRSIPVVKNTPTANDYQKGYYRRYFSKKVNETKYLEIDKNTYDDISNKKGTYDYNLYSVGSLVWTIKGPDIHKKNALEIKKAEINNPNIFYLFPILNEFMEPTTEVQEDLFTNGGELYYGTGAEYQGPYHIHPMQGPMVGAKHPPYPHPKLYYFNQLPEINDTSYEDFLANYNKITCYKCITVGFQIITVGPNGNDQLEIPQKEIKSVVRSRLLGCPENSFFDIFNSATGTITSGYDQAHEACFPDQPAPEPGTLGPGGVREPILEGPPLVPIYATFPNSNDYNGGDYNPFGFPPSNWEAWSSGGAGSSGYSGGPSGGNVTDILYTCFTPNTLITMADGSEKPISSIKKGEKVKSEQGESTVLEIQIHEGDHEVYSINGGKPFVTEEHPFKTIDGWKAIDPFLTFEKH